MELRKKLRELGSKENVERYVKGELDYDFSLEEMRKVIFERDPEMMDEGAGGGDRRRGNNRTDHCRLTLTLCEGVCCVRSRRREAAESFP